VRQDQKTAVIKCLKRLEILRYDMQHVVERYGMRASLANLTPKRLLTQAFAYSIANPLLHHIWFFLEGDTQNIVQRFFVMFIGDLAGALIVLYAVKGILVLQSPKRSVDA
jgi:hypothetical protein